MSKRAISDLDDEECNIVFAKMSTEDKRLCLHAVLPDEVQVYMDSAQWRNILNIIVRYVDLQTWGRMHRVCKLFNRSLPVFPDLQFLHDLFSRVTLSKAETDAFVQDVNSALELCRRYFTPCVRRLIQAAHKFSAWFRLEQAMLNARTRVGTCRVYIPVGKRTYARFPFGYIKASAGGMVHGNIFIDDWKDTFCIHWRDGLSFKLQRDMSKKRKLHAARQKKQSALFK
jgi:hypothetical protein